AVEGAPGDPPEPAGEAVRPSARRWRDVAGICLVVAAALAWCYPAVVHGFVYGSYDIGLSLTSLGGGLFPHVHNALSSDQVLQDAAWLRFDARSLGDWSFPLWNHLNALGAPQLLDFQSGVLSFPSLVAYLVPAPFAYTAQVLVKLVVSGTGAYAAARALRISPLGAALAGVVGELAGPISAWAGWPQVAVSEWTGWMVAAAVVILTRRPRRWPVAGLAVAVAFAVYGGFPELLILVGIGMAVLVLGLAVVGAGDGTARSIGAWLRLGSGVAIGLALSAPLWLPGLGVLQRSAAWGRLEGSQPGEAALGLLTNGWFGTPLTGSSWFGPLNYYETAAYVGVPVLILGMAALAGWRRRPATLAVVAAAVVEAVLAYGPGPLVSLTKQVPVFNGVALGRAVVPLATFLALLAGAGLDAVLAGRGPGRRFTVAGAWLGIAGVGATVLVLYLRASGSSLPHVEQAIRLRSLVWPAALLGGTAVLAVAALVSGRLARAVAAMLVLAEASFLVVAGAPLNTWGRRAYPSTPAIAALKAVVGSSLLGVGENQGAQGVPAAGILPDANLAYGISELALYDDTTPRALERAWARYSGAPLSDRQFTRGYTRFEPPIRTASEARLFGVRYVIFPPGAKAAPGSGFTPRGSFAGEALYEVPGASRATWDASPGNAVTSPLRFVSDNVARLSVAAPQAGWLDLRITYTPAWSATVDGRPATLRRWDAGMLRVHVPAGGHSVRLRYWPPRLSAGIGCAAAGVLALLLLAVVPRSARRRSG
ncbi:MAG: YfhO family protein, partial [Acidimicrobiales bacterium]